VFSPRLIPDTTRSGFSVSRLFKARRTQLAGRAAMRYHFPAGASVFTSGSISRVMSGSA
jgi:hypothetical protein